jgi:hypothetical protein
MNCRRFKLYSGNKMTDQDTTGTVSDTSIVTEEIIEVQTGFTQKLNIFKDGS